ncbi:MAG: transcriptional regulator, partial [Solirubrobacteraceae bacterium]
MSAPQLLEELRRELAPVEQAIRAHRFLVAAPPAESLRAFVGEQYTILRSDRRSFASLAARFPEPPAGDLFIGLAQGEGEALARLFALAASLGVNESGLIGYEPKPGCQAYTGFVSWLALNGSRAELAFAFLANLAAWGENCRRLADLLHDRCDTSFFDFFAEPAPGFEARAQRRNRRRT